VWRRNDQKAPKSFICSSSAHPQRLTYFRSRDADGNKISLEPPLLLHLHEKSTKIGDCTQKCCFVDAAFLASTPCALREEWIHFCCTLAERNTRFPKDALGAFSELVKHPDCVKATHQFTYVRRLFAFMRLNPF
jgi:hypothetical protein